MPREVDQRDRRPNQRTPGPEVSVGLLGAAPTEGGYVERALAFLQQPGAAAPVADGLLGAAAPGGSALSFVADSQVQMTSGNQSVVHAQQYHQGIPIFKATELVRFGPDGQIIERVGSSIPALGAQPIIVRTSAAMAVLAAVHYVAQPDDAPADEMRGGTRSAGVDLAGFVPQIRTYAADQPEQTTIFEPGPTGDSISASLVWFPISGGIALAWEVVVTSPDQIHQYRIVLSANSGEVWYCRDTQPCLAAVGNVYHLHAAQPRELTPFPVDRDAHGVGDNGALPASFPEPWVSGQTLDGNYARVTMNGANVAVRGALSGGKVIFDPAQTSLEQLALNAFYFICRMHDYFYMLGFREPDGSFQPAGARVEATIHHEEIPLVASMRVYMGRPGAVMRLGSYSATGRHTALDASVVFHEYTHGVTKRLIGGLRNQSVIEDPQGRALGEGWSDFFACAVTGEDRIAAWLTGKADGLRSHPYNAAYPGTIADIGQAPYTGIYMIGEIWCATLLGMCREIGTGLGVQLVVDGLKLLSAEPTFLEARDALIVALDGKRGAGQISAAQHASALAGIWRAFAHHGMGPQARMDDTSFSAVAASDFSTAVPTTQQTSIALSDTPNLIIPDNQPSGITRVLTVDAPGHVREVCVGLNVEHTYISDLHVSLRNPNGQRVVLHDREGGAGKNLTRQYSVRDAPPLGTFLGGPSRGNWVLEIADLVALDQGTLRDWSLNLTVDA